MADYWFLPKILILKNDLIILNCDNVINNIDIILYETNIFKKHSLA